MLVDLAARVHIVIARSIQKTGPLVGVQHSANRDEFEINAENGATCSAKELN